MVVCCLCACHTKLGSGQEGLGISKIIGKGSLYTPMIAGKLGVVFVARVLGLSRTPAGAKVVVVGQLYKVGLLAHGSPIFACVGQGH